MRIAVMTGLILLLCSMRALADEPPASYVARQHVLGRVFMSDAERRQLDVLRKTRGAIETPGKVSSSPGTAPANTARTTQPSGYIVPSNGRPYQWIDGDFRRVAKIEAHASDVSSSVKISRIKTTTDGDDDSSGARRPAVESDDETRAPH